MRTLPPFWTISVPGIWSRMAAQIQPFWRMPAG
jgi:hypothetical protein